jgi:hypothetical protein
MGVFRKTGHVGAWIGAFQTKPRGCFCCKAQHRQDMQAISRGYTPVLFSLKEPPMESSDPVSEADRWLQGGLAGVSLSPMQATHSACNAGTSRVRDRPPANVPGSSQEASKNAMEQHRRLSRECPEDFFSSL